MAGVNPLDFTGRFIQIPLSVCYATETCDGNEGVRSLTMNEEW